MSMGESVIGHRHLIDIGTHVGLLITVIILQLP